MDLRSVSGSCRIPLGIFKPRRSVRPVLYHLRSRSAYPDIFSWRSPEEASVCRKDTGHTGSCFYRYRGDHNRSGAYSQLHHGVHSGRMAVGLHPVSFQFRRPHRTESQHPFRHRRYGLSLSAAAAV